MKKLKRLLAIIYDIPNALRVIEIMDEAGVDIYKVDRPGCDGGDFWEVVPKWYLSGKDAHDLQNITLFGKQYRKRSKLWHWIFRGFRPNCRIKYYWF